jgi:predicted solute-binding protein
VPFPIKMISLPLILTIAFGAGCSSEEAETEAKKLEEETKNAAKETTEKSKELTEKVKEETPGIIQNMKDTYKESEQELKDNTLQKGDQAIVQKDSYLALTPEAYDELYQLIEVNDVQGVDKIVDEQQVMEIKQGSEAEVIERDIRRTKVIIKESNKEGYLPTSLLEPKK